MDNTNNNQGGNKLKQIEKDGNTAKGIAGTIIAGAVATTVALMAKGSGKTILKIGKFVLTKK